MSKKRISILLVLILCLTVVSVVGTPPEPPLLPEIPTFSVVVEENTTTIVKPSSSGGPSGSGKKSTPLVNTTKSTNESLNSSVNTSKSQEVPSDLLFGENSLVQDDLGNESGDANQNEKLSSYDVFVNMVQANKTELVFSVIGLILVNLFAIFVFKKKALFLKKEDGKKNEAQQKAAANVQSKPLQNQPLPQYVQQRPQTSQTIPQQQAQINRPVQPVQSVQPVRPQVVQQRQQPATTPQQVTQIRPIQPNQPVQTKGTVIPKVSTTQVAQTTRSVQSTPVQNHQQQVVNSLKQIAKPEQKKVEAKSNNLKK